MGFEIDGTEETGGSLAVQQHGGALDVAMSKAAQEVQAACVIAKRFPRNQTQAHDRILEACKRKGLAEQALYEYPRGGQKVTGPSIRMAEMLAQNWGNLDFGVVEVEQRHGESTCMAYAWDLETNTRQTKVFTVKHERHTKQGITRLNDPRDIYEMVANQGARRVRACVLGVIPGDIIDSAVEECDKTLAGNNKEPLADRIRKMAAWFKDQGITQDRVESKLGHPLDSCTEREIARLAKIANSIRDGIGKAEEFFPQIATAAESQKGVSGLKAKLGKNKGEKPQEPPTEKIPGMDEDAPDIPFGDDNRL